MHAREHDRSPRRMHAWTRTMMECSVAALRLLHLGWAASMARNCLLLSFWFFLVDLQAVELEVGLVWEVLYGDSSRALWRADQNLTLCHAMEYARTTHTGMHAVARANACGYTCTHMHGCKCAPTHAHAHTCTQARARTWTNSCTCI